MYEFSRILKMDFKNLCLNPMWWIGTIGLPLFLALVMGFVTRGTYGNAVTSYDYYAVTMIVFGALNNATLAANSFMEGRILQANMRLCNAPIPSSFIFLPKIIASFLFSVICITIAGAILAFAVGANFGGVNAVFLWILMVVVNFFAVCVGVLLCCLLKNEETVNQILSTLVAVLCLAGGAFFPLKGLGKVVDVVSNVSPVTWIDAAAFSAIYDSDFMLLGIVTAVLLALSLVCIGLSGKFFSTEDYL